MDTLAAESASDRTGRQLETLREMSELARAVLRRTAAQIVAAPAAATAASERHQQAVETAFHRLGNLIRGIIALELRIARPTPQLRAARRQTEETPPEEAGLQPLPARPSAADRLQAQTQAIQNQIRELTAREAEAAETAPATPHLCRQQRRALAKRQRQQSRQAAHA